jgi:hypothetical protein
MENINNRLQSDFINPAEAADFFGIPIEEMHHLVENNQLSFPYRTNEGVLIATKDILTTQLVLAGYDIESLLDN